MTVPDDRLAELADRCQRRIRDMGPAGATMLLAAEEVLALVEEIQATRRRLGGSSLTYDRPEDFTGGRTA